MRGNCQTVPVTQDELDEAVAAIEWDMIPALQRNVPIGTTLIGVSGGATTLSAVKHQLTEYDARIVDGSVVTLTDIDQQITLYHSKTLAEHQQIPGLQPGRADVILAGTLIVRVIMQQCQVTAFTVSDRGLRHGVIVDRFYKNDRHIM